ncbi:MAG: NlpC/P60 family protein, partial [Eubacterium sp.]|nr:NlpC/P60 family protein [Eubacterium sp.]
LKTKKTTGGVTKRVKVGESLGKVVTTGYCPCAICCVQYAGGPTASGAMPTPNHTIAVDARHPVVPMGTKVIMNGVEYSVEDTGAFAQNGVAFDVFYSTHQEALNHGRRTWEAYLADDNGSKEVEVTVSDGSSVTAVLSNGGIDKAAKALLTDDEYAWYQLLVETKGNREDLFKDLTYCNTAGGANYQIPGEALSDQKFAGMMQEAEKYLGRAYVWGGASPSTGFDCSGFVCWVINHSGNGWNVGRTTADGLRQMLAPVSASDAKPGDIIFFQNTYATAGASHVGIYVGNNMMIHCGDPIKFSRIDTPYWQQHFLSFGRLPS